MPPAADLALLKEFDVAIDEETRVPVCTDMNCRYAYDLTNFV